MACMTLLKLIALYLILASLCKGINSNGHEQSLQNLKHGGKMTHFFKERIPLLSSRTDLIKESPIPHNHVHQVIIVVQQNNMDELTRILHDVSDPMSSRYGQHMSGEQIHAMTSNLEARDAIVAYLHLNGASVVSETLSGDSMTVNAPISAWERVLDTKFTTFHQLQAEGTAETIVRAKTYSIPRELDMYVDSVLNVIEMPYRQSHRQKAPTENRFKEQATESYGYLRPQEIRQYYNMSVSVRIISVLNH
jgi:subtilase family serine protease